MRLAVGFARFWWDFVVGEDWRIAAGVALVLAVAAVLVADTGASDALVAVLAAAGTALVAIGAIVRSAKRK